MDNRSCKNTIAAMTTSATSALSITPSEQSRNGRQGITCSDFGHYPGRGRIPRRVEAVQLDFERQAND